VSRLPDTIAAIATAPGRGAIGVVRVSGPLAESIAVAIVGRLPPPRHATLCDFLGTDGALVDQGIALFFPGPASFTGESVLELQGHGGAVVLRELVRHCITLGARLAEPGEFTRRAFLNDRLDLAQAEAVADLIDASSAEAARGAARSLAGEFSRRVSNVVGAVVDLRMHVEASIDFPEEEIDPEGRDVQWKRLDSIRASLAELLREASQGAILRDGLTVVLAGRPNVGKSSLLNRLAGEDLAIVTPVPGTTRDFVRATILLDGVPIHLVDTAGLRDAADDVERVGVDRAWDAIAKAGAVMFVSDISSSEEGDEAAILKKLPVGTPVGRVQNKIDLLGREAGTETSGDETVIRLSALTGDGVAGLRAWLLRVAGWQPHGEGVFLARERHLAAMRGAQANLVSAAANWERLELVAEDLRQAQRELDTITGETTADDLLGQIFGRFCIGK
jgi:tRNA modification GTPase